TFAAVIGSFLVSYTRAKAEALGLRGDVGFGSRVERVVLISVGLGLAPWGLLQWPIYVLAAMAWITVVQRILFVRRQLRELADAPGPARNCRWASPRHRGGTPRIGTLAPSQSAPLTTGAEGRQRGEGRPRRTRTWRSSRVRPCACQRHRRRC